MDDRSAALKEKITANGVDFQLDDDIPLQVQNCVRRNDNMIYKIISNSFGKYVSGLHLIA